jgi:hypothetical protein
MAGKRHMMRPVLLKVGGVIWPSLPYQLQLVLPLVIFSKLVVGMIKAFCAVVRWRRRGRVIAKGYTQQELDALIRFACGTLPECTDSAEEFALFL